MVVEQFPNFAEWIGPGALLFGTIVLAAIVLGIFFGYLVASLRHGPFEAFYVVAQVIAEALPDFLYASPRRVWAIARLAIKEALRRRVILVGCGIFALTFLFGGWFMDAGSEKPEQIYINFVMWGTQLLALMVSMLISAFGLPEDIKHKTIYTVVTKPVRPTEVVFGRILGLGLLGTALLAMMAIVSFLFVWRGLAHTHLIVGDDQTLASFVEIDPNTRLSPFSEKRVAENVLMEAETTKDSGHKHRLFLVENIYNQDEPGPRYQKNLLEKVELEGNRIAYRQVVCEKIGGHTHAVTVEGTGESAKITLGPAIGYFMARVPLYAEKLQFYNRFGQPDEDGTNIGDEWTYRGYIDGGSTGIRATLSKAEFYFDDFVESRFGDTDIVALDLTLGVFRTHKGNIEKRVTGGLQFETIPDSEADNVIISEMQEFETEEFEVQTLRIDGKLAGKTLSPDGKLLEQGKYDLFEDYAKNGKLKLVVTCRDWGQYLGFAQGDVYFQAGSGPYWANFVKGYLGIWCQMVIIISMGVALSTFLSSPTTMLGTVMMIIIGFFTEFIRGLMIREGGGPIESFIRVVTQKNMVTPLETGWFTTLIGLGDNILSQMLKAITYLAPDFSKLDFSDFLTYGYSIDNQRVLLALTITFAFCAGLTVLGYFVLKTREIAK